MLLLIDNYDSFTYNLFQYLSELGAEIVVRRNDAVTLEEIERMAPDRIVISPGPGTPDEAGISCDVVRQFGPKIPLLGVCLGHQCIGQVFGGPIVRADRIVHGKVSPISHDGKSVFLDVDQQFKATRYHSLVIDRAKVPDVLKVTAVSFGDAEVMGVRHKELPIEGVQFHPESILTSEGKRILRNFLERGVVH
jgi:anthranilate synthase/aminodeoxychorismate synthase-like glutamine amidotransferase